MAFTRAIFALAVSFAALAGPAFAQDHAHEQPMPPTNRWSFAGQRRLKGLREPVRLFRARRLLPG